MKSLALLLLFLCSNLFAEQAASKLSGIIDNIESVDISFHEKKWYRVGQKRSNISTLKLQNDLFKYVANHSDIKLLSSQEYLYQYKYLNNNEIEIRGICFGVPNTRDIESEFMVVMDGGNCIFYIKYNLKKSSFYDFFINGEA